MRYILKHKEYELLFFDREGTEITSVIVKEENLDRLPLTVRGIFIDPAGCIEKAEADYLFLSDEGIYLFDLWLVNRSASADRSDLRFIIPGNKSVTDWMLDNHSLSFTDCYWTETMEESLSWEEIRLKPEQLKQYITIDGSADINSLMRHGSNASLGGQLVKYWFVKQENILALHKQTSGMDEILGIREKFASLIYERQGINACKYELTFQDETVNGCECNAFTDSDTELITAYDLLSEYKLDQLEDTYELIIKLAELKGLDLKQVANHIDRQLIVDYLVFNRDRHLGNLGFLRDSESLRFTGVAPVYDSGSSRILEGKLPEEGPDVQVNSLYKTESEVISHIRDFNSIDASLLPSAEEYRRLLDLGRNLSQSRKDKLCKLYKERISHLERLQQSQKTPSYVMSDISKSNLKKVKL